MTRLEAGVLLGAYLVLGLVIVGVLLAVIWGGGRNGR